MGKLTIVAKNPEVIPQIRTKLTILLLELQFEKEGKVIPKDIITEMID